MLAGFAARSLLETYSAELYSSLHVVFCSQSALGKIRMNGVGRRDYFMPPIPPFHNDITIYLQGARVLFGLVISILVAFMSSYCLTSVDKGPF